MKKYLPVIALLLPITANAASLLEFCTAYSEVASRFMIARQNGVTMVKIMEVSGKDPLLIELTKRAYKEPRWSTDANKQRAVQDFVNDFTSQCLDAEL